MRLLYSLRSSWRPQSVGRIHSSDPSLAVRQDLPPKGGYAPINFTRVPARQIVNGPILFGGFILSQGRQGLCPAASYCIQSFNTVIGVVLYKRNKRVWAKEQVEENSTRFGMEPLLVAEWDRTRLRELRKIRDEENELMKDVPGWETGTWFGQPVYRTLKEDEWVDPHEEEYWVHSNPKVARRERYFKEWVNF